MANSVDSRIVNMQFDNAQFERGVRQTNQTLEKLKENLKFKNAGKGFEDIERASNKVKFAGLKSAVDSIAERFSSMGVVGMTVLQNLTNSAVEAGKRIVSAFTLDPIKMGFQEYETQINAVQTILANTSSKGTNLQQVNAALDELNHYADKTIYNFTEMTRNIGTFTAAGVDLDTSVQAIKGIANLAAVSGSNSQQASTAMYQLSQALAAGTVKLMDWNSVVNAGMGGQVFQDALKETARVHGVKIDEMIKKEGSFRETLQHGWLTSAILTETLAKFTGDLSEEQLRSIGYTDEQIKGIMEMGRTANDAATKVKTFSQLMDTLKEAAQSGWTQSWEIIVGDFEEAKSLLTEISDTFSGIINDSAEARNAVLQEWKDLGGRADLIDALRNAFQGIMSIVKPISEAFSEIIPPITAQTLYNFTAGLKDLTSKLIISEETASKLKRTFKGVFSVIDIVRQAIGTAIGIVGNFASKILGLSDGFLDTTASIGDFLVGIDEAVKSSGIFATVADSISKVFSNIVDVISNIAGFLSSGISAFISGGVESIISLGSKIAPVLENIFSTIKSIFSSGVSSIDFNTIFAGITAGLGAGILLNITKIVGKIKEVFENGIDSIPLVSSIKETISGLTDSLNELQTTIRSATLLAIATAVGILAASLVALSRVNADQLAIAFSGLTGIFVDLVGSLYILQGFDFAKGTGSIIKMSGVMISLAIAVNILASAVTKLSSLDLPGLAKGLAGVGVILLELAGFMKIADFGKINTKSMASLIFLAAALNLLAVAVDKLGQIDIPSLIQGLISVGVLLSELAVFTNYVGDSKGLISTGVALIAISSAMIILSQAVAAFGSMPLKDLAQGLISIGIALSMIGLIMDKLMPEKMLGSSAALVLVAGSMIILSSAISVLGSMSLESIAKGLIALGGSMVIIAGAMKLMQGSISGAVALTVVAGALMILTPVLMTLGSMSLEQIGTGLLALAGTFTVLGVASALLSPVVPTLLGLGAAVALLGVGLGAAGVGVAALAVGLVALGTSGAMASAGLVSMVQNLLTLIPVLFEAIAAGIVAFLGAIASSAQAIVSAITTILTAILTAIIDIAPVLGQAVLVIITTICNTIIQAVPQIMAAATALIQGFCNTVVQNFPTIINTGMQMIISFINAVADNVGQIVTAAVRAITEFINAISANIGSVIDSAIKLAISFINGVADGISNNQEAFKSAIRNLISSIGGVISGMIGDLLGFGRNILQGIANGIRNAVGTVISAITGAVNSAINAAKSLLGIASPSKVFAEMGKFCMLGFANQIESMSDGVAAITSDAAGKSVDGFSNAISAIKDNVTSVDGFNPTITPVIDMSNVNQGVSQLDSLLGNREINIQPTIGLSRMSMSQTNQNGSSDSSNSGAKESSKVYNFTQNNYSPKALSRTEIYRQTKSQFVRAKGALSAL